MDKARGRDGDALEADLGDQPPVVFGRERRLHARAHAGWMALARGREMPALAELDRLERDKLAGHWALIAPSNGVTPARVLAVGDALREEAGRGRADPATPERVAPSHVLGELVHRLPDIVAHRAPVTFEGEFLSASGTAALHRGILLPFAGRDGAVAAVLGVLNWHKLAQPHDAPDVAAAVTSAFDRRPAAPSPSPWAQDRAAAGGRTPAPTIDRRLAAARTWAALALSNRPLGDAGRHAAIGAAYDLLLAVQTDRAARVQLQRITRRRIRPTPGNIVALVFDGHGPVLLRSERQRYALTLAYADRLGLGSGQLAGWLEGYTGGVAAAAKAERRLRAMGRAGGATDGADRREADAPADRIALRPVGDARPPFGRHPRAIDLSAPPRRRVG
jgi:hypothetical protein